MISYRAPPLHTGAGQQALRLAAALRERGLEATVLTARQNGDLAPREEQLGVAVVRLPVIRLGRLGPLSYSLGAALHLLRYRRSYDIVHVHGAFWHAYPVLLASRWAGVRSIVKLTSSGEDDPQTILGRPGGWILLRALAGAGAVVAMTAELAHSYLESGLPPGKLARIPNGVDTREFVPVEGERRARLRVELGVHCDAMVVLFVGVVRWLKGVDVLLDAWERVHERLPDSELYLVGPLSSKPEPDGRPFSEVMRQYLATRAWSTRVHLVGRRPDVHRWCQAADVFVLPSRVEGLPNALLEAMACGLPVVTTDIGGLLEVVRDKENGLIVSADNARALAGALICLLKDRQRARSYGHAAWQTIRERFSISAVVGRYVDLYESLLLRPR